MPMTVGRTRELLMSGILQFLTGQDLLALAEIRAALEREIDDAGPASLVALRDRLTLDVGWTYYPPDPLARRIHLLLATRFVQPDSQVTGLEHLEVIAGEPVIIVSNHLSYADANVLHVMLHRVGRCDLADRLTAMAGPKVFTVRERRFSSLCFGTIKVPQSRDVSSEEAVQDAREVARAARRAIEIAAERVASGDALVLFGEGTRSRSAQMQRMLAGVARYLEVPGAWVLPVGLTGSELLFPIGDVTVRPARVDVTIGTPMRTDALLQLATRHRQTAMDFVGLAIAELVPPSYRGVYGDTATFPDAAQALSERRAANRH
jgi:1-acyl-sn-glycerol-3-phosphate acyltransferase